MRNFILTAISVLFLLKQVKILYIYLLRWDHHLLANLKKTQTVSIFYQSLQQDSCIYSYVIMISMHKKPCFTLAQFTLLMDWNYSWEFDNVYLFPKLIQWPLQMVENGSK